MRPSEPPAHVGTVDHDRSRALTRGERRGRLAQQSPELALEVPHAGFPGVVGHDGAQRVVGELHLVVPQRGTTELAPDQMVLGDRDLLVLGVAVEPDDLHAVEQRARDRLHDVGRRDEQHPRQVEVHLEVVVAERVVLRRVEHLEQGRRRVTPVVVAQLVHLVEHDDGIHGPGLAQGTHQAARLGPHVGAAVAADLGLVTHAAQGDPDELAPERVGHGLAQRRLADAGGTDQGQDGARAAPVDRRQPALGLELAHGQVLEDAVLHVLEAVVVGVEDALGLRDVEAVVRLDAPGDLEHGVEPGADPPGLGALVAGALELVDLALDRSPDVLGQVTRLELGPVVVGVVVGLVARELSQLLADGLELAAQEELALRLLHAFLDVGLDLLAQGQVGQRVAGPTQHQAQPCLDVERLEHLDLLAQREVG